MEHNLVISCICVRDGGEKEEFVEWRKLKSEPKIQAWLLLHSDWVTHSCVWSSFPFHSSSRFKPCHQWKTKLPWKWWPSLLLLHFLSFSASISWSGSFFFLLLFTLILEKTQTSLVCGIGKWTDSRADSEERDT